MTENRNDTVILAGTAVLLLKNFIDVLRENFRGKDYSYTVEPAASVPESSMQLWRQRGFEPSGTGVAKVRFDGVQKEYIYPAYFWSE